MVDRMTREEALQKIDELKKYIESCDQAIKGMHIYGGAMFMQEGMPGTKVHCIKISEMGKYALLDAKYLSVVRAVPGVCTKDKMADYLNRHGYTRYFTDGENRKWTGSWRPASSE